jgi:hypothetical protein
MFLTHNSITYIVSHRLQKHINELRMFVRKTFVLLQTDWQS